MRINKIIKLILVVKKCCATNITKINALRKFLCRNINNKCKLFVKFWPVNFMTLTFWKLLDCLDWPIILWVTLPLKSDSFSSLNSPLTTAVPSHCGAGLETTVKNGQIWLFIFFTLIYLTCLVLANKILFILYLLSQLAQGRHPLSPDSTNCNSMWLVCFRLMRWWVAYYVTLFNGIFKSGSVGQFWSGSLSHNCCNNG